MGQGDGLGGCYTCIKYLMFAFNLLFWLLGCAIIGVAIWVLVDPQFKQYIDNAEQFKSFYTAAYILIGIGAVIMIIGFLGCCGAIRESQCMLATFFVSLFIIFIVLLAAGIWAIVNKNSFKGVVSEVLEDAVKNYKTNPASKNLMDAVQTNLECCGYLTGALDYGLPGAAPSSCKVLNALKPCPDKLFQLFSDNLLIVAGVAIGIGCVMLMGMAFSMVLCCAIRKATD